MENQLKWLFVLCSLEIIFSFLIKMSSLRAIEAEFALFHPLENPNVAFLVWPKTWKTLKNLRENSGKFEVLWKKHGKLRENVKYVT